MFPLKILRRDDIIHVGNELVMDSVMKEAADRVKNEVREHVAKTSRYSEDVESYVNMVVSDQCLGCPEIKWDQKEFRLLDRKVQVMIPIEGRAEVLGMYPWKVKAPSHSPGGIVDKGLLVNEWEIVTLFSSEKDAEDEIQTLFNAWSKRMAGFVTMLQDKYQSWEKDTIQEGVSLMHVTRDRKQRDLEQKSLLESAINRLNQRGME